MTYRKYDGKSDEERRKIIKEQMRDLEMREIIHQAFQKYYGQGIVVGSTFYYRGSKINLN